VGLPDLLELMLSEITTGRVERWRATRRNQQRRSESAEKKAERPVSRATINRNIQALRAALARAAEWGSLSTNPLARMKQGTKTRTLSSVTSLARTNSVFKARSPNATTPVGLRASRPTPGGLSEGTNLGPNTSRTLTT
jgi:site-specific recombinase XerD